MGEGSASRPGRSLPPGKTRYPLYRRLGGPQGRSGQVRKKSRLPPGFDARTVQLVARSYTDWATRATTWNCCLVKIRIEPKLITGLLKDTVPNRLISFKLKHKESFDFKLRISKMNAWDLIGYFTEIYEHRHWENRGKSQGKEHNSVFSVGYIWIRESREDSIPPTVKLTSTRWLLDNANEALPTETGRYNPNTSNEGNVIYHPEFSEAGWEAIFGRSNTELGRHRQISCELLNQIINSLNPN